MAGKKVYIIYGEEEYIRQKAVNALIDSLQLQLPDLNHSVLLNRAKLADIITACETLPLMDEKRLVHVKNHEMFTSKAEDTKLLEEYLVKIPESTVLLFDNTGKIDKRRRLYKAIEKAGQVKEYSKPAYGEIIKIVADEAKKRGLMLSNDAAPALVAQSGQDIFTLISELDKFAGFKQGGTITKADIEEFASRSLEYNVFSLHALFMQGKAGEALALLNQVMEAEKNPFGVIGLVASKFRLMLKARALMEAGYTAAEVQKNMGGNPYAAKEAVQDAKKLSTAQIREGLNLLAELDYSLKSGQGGRYLTETVFLKIYHPKAV